MFANGIADEDLSTTEDFDESILSLLETTPQPFDIFQTTGPVIDEIRLWTSGPDYLETTEGPFAFTTEEIDFGAFTTGAPEIDLSTVMTFPTDAPRIFTTGSIFDFTTFPDLVTLGVTAPVTGLPPIPETTEFVPLETTAPPMIIDFTTPFQLTPTAPEWLFQTTVGFDFPEITEDFTGLPFLSTPQPINSVITEPTQPVEQPKPNPDGLDWITALENYSESDQTDENPTIIDDNSVAVLIPVPNKSTTSSPVISSTSTTTTTISSTSTTSTTTSTTMSSTTNSSTTTSSTTTISTKSNSITTTSTSTTTTTSSSMSPLETTAVVESFPDTTADDSMITNSLTTETDVSSVVVDVTTPVDLVVELTTGDIDVTGNACFIIYQEYIMICKSYFVCNMKYIL